MPRSPEQTPVDTGTPPPTTVPPTNPAPHKRLLSRPWFWVVLVLLALIVLAVLICWWLDYTPGEALCELRGGQPIAYDCDASGHRCASACLDKAADGGQTCGRDDECSSHGCLVTGFITVDLDKAQFDEDGYIRGTCANYQVVTDCPPNTDCILGCHIPRPATRADITDVAICEPEH